MRQIFVTILPCRQMHTSFNRGSLDRRTFIDYLQIFELELRMEMQNWDPNKKTFELKTSAVQHPTQLQSQS